MVRLWGEIALCGALVFSFMQSVVPLFGYWRQNIYALAFARTSAYGQCVFVCMAYGLLTLAFAINDFSIAYVASNSHPSLPLYYRLTAVWGGHEGSILLWALFLNGWTMVFLLYSKMQNSLRNKLVDIQLTVAILGFISFCFLSFLLLTSNPFALADFPIAAHDLNPLLQDPGFVIHPPMLYAGYVGAAVAFAITLAAVVRGDLNQSWATTTRQFALAAWCCLTLGITLGSWWAYRVLGWGGFWFWDPVENASLLPWLSGTALLHVLVLCEKRDRGTAWAALLALISFALSILGTFLVRSGVLVSAHTFANDPRRGIFLLLLFIFLVTAALIIYKVKLPKALSMKEADFAPFSLLSRETLLIVNSALLMVAMSTILLGTLYPLLLDALQWGAVSVGAPYFNQVLLPLVWIILLCMGFVPFLGWQSCSFATLWQQAWKKALISIISATAFLWAVVGELDSIAILSLSLSLWAILGLTQAVPRLSAMSVAHSGFAILIIAVVLSSLLGQERDVRIKPGETTQLGPYQFYFMDTKGVMGENYRAIQAEFAVEKNGRKITQLWPEKRLYTVRDIVMTKVAIHPGIFRDLYIALGEPLNDDYWSVRLYYKPFVRWIWFGGILMIMGGVFALLQHKKSA